jgi:hypothetical protein
MSDQIGFTCGRLNCNLTLIWLFHLASVSNVKYIFNKLTVNVQSIPMIIITYVGSRGENILKQYQ